jgi:hypothetical protein
LSQLFPSQSFIPKSDQPVFVGLRKRTQEDFAEMGRSGVEFHALKHIKKRVSRIPIFSRSTKAEKLRPLWN